MAFPLLALEEEEKPGELCPRRDSAAPTGFCRKLSGIIALCEGGTPGAGGTAASRPISPSKGEAKWLITVYWMAMALSSYDRP